MFNIVLDAAATETTTEVTNSTIHAVKDAS